MRRSTRIKSATLFTAITALAGWGVVSIAPASKEEPKKEVRPVVDEAFHAVRGMVVTYTDGFAGGGVDDGKGTTTYKEPYDPTIFVVDVVDGRPHRDEEGGYFGWTITIPSACATKGRSAVGRTMPIRVRNAVSDDDEKVRRIDADAVKGTVCGADSKT